MPAYRAPDEFYREMNYLVEEMQREAKSKIPAEPSSPNPINAVVNAANSLMNRVADSPVGRTINNASERFPYLRERPISTPFGRVKLPEIKLPEVHEIELDTRKREALKAVIAVDLAQIAGLVPVLGDAVADVIEDTFQETVRDSLDDREFRAYTKYDKLGPSTIAMARTFMLTNKPRGA